MIHKCFNTFKEVCLQIPTQKLRKILNTKIAQLNDIIADLDSIVTDIGFEFYRVCIFGSARLKPDSQHYKAVYDLAFALASRNVDIVTGGGPGLMEAANLGAKAASKVSRSSKSIGLPIELPFEKTANQHLDVKYHHRRFSSRLDEFMRLSHAVVVTPGGIGTLLELLFTWQLIVVDHMVHKPVILLGKDMWEGFIDWMKKEPLSRNLVNQTDFDLLQIVDSVDEVIEILAPKIAAFQSANQNKHQLHHTDTTSLSIKK